jgi:hypothetical protein
MAGSRWNILVVDRSETSRFAAEEFSRLIAVMDPGCSAQISAGGSAPEDGALRIGLDPALPCPPVADPVFDDALRIEVADGAGFITGSNPRSVLIGVYRFFREAGCVFVRPGREGEYIPVRDSSEIAVSVSECAAYRHRGLCLEGSAAYENVVELIDLAPKLGFNAYFTQLFRPAFAFRRWYEHQKNPHLTREILADAEIDIFVKGYDREIARRGMIHHRIGHGWIPKVLGITSGAWHEANSDGEADPGLMPLTALVGGKRGLFGGSAIDTNFCLSEPRAAELLADEVIKFARANPELKCLHFWLADHANNQCECEKCKDKRPADQYIGVLNLIDEKLAAAKLPTRIFFLVYLDLLWPPVTAKLDHPERFTLLYAPIRRSYSVPMAEDADHESVPFVRNGFVPEPSAGGTLPYLAAWRKAFGGECVVFDYHYMWDYLCDPAGAECARIMEKDVENLRRLGLDGMLSCQNQRVFLPNGLGMSLMGEALWSGKADPDGRWKKYFAAAYGAEGEKVREYLENLSAWFDPPVLRGEKPVNAPETAAKYRKIPAVVDAFLQAAEKRLADEKLPEVQRRSWECLAFHARLCRRIAAVLTACAEGRNDAAAENWAKLKDFACENENRFQREFDVFEFILVWESKILPRLLAKREDDVE